MTLSLWRYGHLALALSSSVFVLLASLTGIVLAFEPISNQLKPYSLTAAQSRQPLAQTVHALRERYAEVIEISRDSHGFLSVSVITQEGESETFYIDPSTGRKTGEIVEKAALFRFMTHLHRSLFLKGAGRFFVGLTSFFLFLIAITGAVLIIKRQRGVKRFFSKIIKDGFYPYYHTFFGRLSLLPILILTLTGVYLSLGKFALLPTFSPSHQIDFGTLAPAPRLAPRDFPVFQQIRLKDLRAVTFPFSEEEEDYYHVELSDRELVVHQFTGKVLSEALYPFSTLLTHYSLTLHTGQGSILWSIILLVATCSILFFLYSGFSMTLERRKNPIQNKYGKDECEYVILVGSEGGTTRYPALALHRELLRSGKRSYLTELNSFSHYRNMQHLVVITATYGQGEAPANASRFQDLLSGQSIHKPFTFSVVGFGSLSYPDFCGYALKVDQWLQQQEKGQRIQGVYTINDRSLEAFRQWSEQWGKALGMEIHLPKVTLPVKKAKEQTYKVIDKTPLSEQVDDTFLLTLEPGGASRFQSGDLLSVYPEKGGRERLYSIGKMDDDRLVLSIKRHEKGQVSNQLHRLRPGDALKAAILRNRAFYFPRSVKRVVFIATGTGIGPFLGMLAQNIRQVETHLFWGGRTEESFGLYRDFIVRRLQDRKLTDLHLVYSRAQPEKRYVQHLVTEQSVFMAETLDSSGVIMICGSIPMQKEVIHALDVLCRDLNGKPLSHYQNRGQLRMDCY